MKTFREFINESNHINEADVTMKVNKILGDLAKQHPDLLRGIDPQDIYVFPSGNKADFKIWNIEYSRRAYKLIEDALKEFNAKVTKVDNETAKVTMSW